MQLFALFLRRHKRVMFFLGCTVIVVWAAWLRFSDLGKQSFWLDEAVLVSQARGILKHGVPQMENGVVQWNSSVTTYIIAQGIRLQRDEHVGARLPAAVAGTLCVILIFVATKTFGMSGLASLLASGIMALSIDQISWSRQAEPYIYLQLFFLISIIFCLLYVKHRSPASLVAAAVFAAASVGTHAGGYIAVLAWSVFLVTGLISYVVWSLITCKVVATDRTGQGLPPQIVIERWLICAVLLCSLMVLALFVRLPLGHSNIWVVLNLLRAPYETNYVSQYADVLLASFGFSGLFFAFIGAVAGLVFRPRLAIPLVLAVGIFFAVVSVRMWLFADRYIFPVHAVIIMFISVGMALCSEFLGKLAEKRIGNVVSVLACCLAFALFTIDSNATVRRQSEYLLGYTAPQPDWRTGFMLVRNRHKAGGAPQQQLNVVTPYPVLHDIYLGSETGTKYYLPISFCGTPNAVQWNAPHSQALPIVSLSKLKEIDGYLMMDEMALRMIGCDSISSYLRSTEPDAIVSGRFPVFIWLLRNEKQPNNALLTYSLSADGQVEGER
jgi:hypothetical protein